MKPLRWIHELKADPRPKLFGYQAPGPVRALALRLLEDREEDDFLLKHALRDAGRYQPRVTLLESWRSDGSWGVDRLFMRSYGEGAARDKMLVDTIKNLILLRLYGWRDEGEWVEGYLDEAAELILQRALENGYMQLISEQSLLVPEKDKPWIYSADYWSGVAITALLIHGIDDPRIERFMLWLERNQRTDGGWLPELYRRGHADANNGNELPSHPLHTTNFAWALSIHPKWRTSEVSKRAGSFLLTSALRPLGPYRGVSKERWERLAEPQWGFDALKVLNIALETGFDPEDDRIKRILRRLIDLQQPSGLWRSSRKRPGPDENLFLTLRVVAAFKRIYDDLLPDVEKQN